MSSGQRLNPEKSNPNWTQQPDVFKYSPSSASRHPMSADLLPTILWSVCWLKLNCILISLLLMALKNESKKQCFSPSPFSLSRPLSEALEQPHVVEAISWKTSLWCWWRRWSWWWFLVDSAPKESYRWQGGQNVSWDRFLLPSHSLWLSLSVLPARQQCHLHQFFHSSPSFFHRQIKANIEPTARTPNTN